MAKLKIHKGNKIEHYDFRRKATRPNFMIGVARLVAKITMLGRKMDITYEGEKPTYPRLVLGNHGAFNDFYMLFKAIKTNKLNYIVAIDAFNDLSSPVMHSIGAIAKRKFISDLSLMKNMKYALETLGDTVVMYPEARYSLDGTTSYLPPSLGKLVKFLNVPVSVLIINGNYVSDPQWNKYKQNRVPMEGVMKEIVSKEEIATLSVDEINERIKKSFVYDDFKWLKESGNKIKYKNRAYNLNAILYQCANCKTEFKMQGHGDVLECTACGKKWKMHENGVLEATEGETEFSHIPDWFKWEKENVHKEVFNGSYGMTADCEVYTLPSSKGFVKQGFGKLTQNCEKTILEVTLYGEKKTIEYTGNNLESVHVEYQYKGVGDMFDFSIFGDSIWMRPVNRKDILTKVSLATEEIRDLAKINLNK